MCHEDAPFEVGLGEEVWQGGGMIEMEMGDENNIDLVGIDLIEIGQGIDPFPSGMNATIQLGHRVRRADRHPGPVLTMMVFPLNWRMWQERPTSLPDPSGVIDRKSASSSISRPLSSDSV
jgi:hypothetical protein